MSEITTSVIPGCWADKVAQNKENISWLWEGYLARGHVTLLTSQWKSGKTTLLSILLSKMNQGGALADLPVKPAKAVVISEESEALWAPRYSLLHFPNTYLICRPFRNKPSMDQWLGLLKHVAHLQAEHGMDLAVVDTLATLLPGRNEASAPLMMEALLPLQDLTGRGMGVLLNHHPRKGVPQPGQAARGSGALAGFVDIIMEKSWCGPADDEDRRRKILAFSRFDQTPRQRVIELNAAGTDYLVRGTFQDDEFLANWDKVKMALEDARDWRNREQILADWPADFVKPSETNLRRWLQRGVALGLVVQKGTGKKNDPFRYALPGKEEVWLKDPMYRFNRQYEEDKRSLQEMLDKPLKLPSWPAA